MQMVSLQPNVESSQYHPGRARRFRRFRRFGRYGAKTTSSESSTTQETTTSIESTTTTQAATGTTTTTTTRVVCTGGVTGSLQAGSQVTLNNGPRPPQSMVTIDVNVTSPECECIGSEVFGSIPGFLGVGVGGVEDANAVSFISITSPNGTEAKIATVRSLNTGTVAFNGFPANGSWV